MPENRADRTTHQPPERCPQCESTSLIPVYAHRLCDRCGWHTPGFEKVQFRSSQDYRAPVFLSDLANLPQAAATKFVDAELRSLVAAWRSRWMRWELTEKPSAPTAEKPVEEPEALIYRASPKEIQERTEHLEQEKRDREQSRKFEEADRQRLSERVARKLADPAGYPTMSLAEVRHAFECSAATVYRKKGLTRIARGRFRTESVKTALERDIRKRHSSK